MPRHSRTPTALGLGITAALTLALAAAPAAQAAAPAPDPVPALVAGADTAAPQLVTGLAEPAQGSPADAAKAHLAAHPDRYRIDTAQLTEIASERGPDGRHTVRFQQRHHGIPVFGAQYLVHLTGAGTGQRVESVAGKYFTGLTAPTTATVPDAVLRELALGSLGDPRTRAGARAEDHGQLILPGGGGRLARHFTLRTTPATGGPRAREVYVDATDGTIALSYDARTPDPTTPTTTGSARTAPDAEPATGTAPDALGRTVKVNIGRLPDGSYQLTDLTRPATITTYDAAGRSYYDFGGGIPADVLPAGSPGPDFPASTGSSGATDAHLGATAVYDFYRDRLGRNGLDGKGSPIISVANASDDGTPMNNALWDGQKMIYGVGGGNHRPFSVPLDIAGHEMTHGVIHNTADLVGTGQPGSMNEALADYFGNAIEVTALGTAMNDPKAALLGETLCLTGTPEACAQRRLDDRRTTLNDYLGAGNDVDSGGVHPNSTIFGGALWDIRRTLDPLVADRLIYRALTDYLTPLDEFVDGRNAVLAAGKAMKLTRTQLRSVTAAFDAHGIRAGWQQNLGVDSHLLLRGAASPGKPAVADGRWVMGNTDPAKKSQGTPLYTGSTTGSTAPTRLSPPDQRAHGWSATDGKSAAWVAQGTDNQGVWGFEVLTRSLTGGPIRSLFRSPTQWPADVQISGPDVAFRVGDPTTGRGQVLLFRDGAPAGKLPLPDGHDMTGLTLKDGLLGGTETWTAAAGEVSAPTVYSLADGKATAQYVTGDPNGASGTWTSSTLLAGGRLLWVENPGDRTKRSSIRSGAPNGSGTTDVLRRDTPHAPVNMELTASDRSVTFTTWDTNPAGGWSNAVLPKLWQLPLTGGTPERLSCNRGSQVMAAADQGTRVVWLDSTAGRTDLVARNRPAGTC
ncbi:M4 family metallopeptidase [Streptomyces subrutilus]|uniref:M4 family metallopeptidase n=1 Tax=Streptomyces subrutilus TaxID=36818 RepID=UPI002E0F711B|nr:M4 family metallopeptidase [Streptomyces subrutilus]